MLATTETGVCAIVNTTLRPPGAVFSSDTTGGLARLFRTEFLAGHGRNLQSTLSNG